MKNTRHPSCFNVFAPITLICCYHQMDHMTNGCNTAGQSSDGCSTTGQSNDGCNTAGQSSDGSAGFSRTEALNCVKWMQKRLDPATTAQAHTSGVAKKCRSRRASASDDAVKAWRAAKKQRRANNRFKNKLSDAVLATAGASLSGGIGQQHLLCGTQADQQGHGFQDNRQQHFLAQGASSAVAQANEDGSCSQNDGAS